MLIGVFHQRLIIHIKFCLKVQRPFGAFGAFDSNFLHYENKKNVIF